MFYQVRANLLFTSHDEATDFYHDCQLALPKAAVANPGNENQEPSEIQMIENHHDSDPNEPCAELFSANNAPPPPG